MPTISIRFVNKYDIERWEKLEAKGKLGPRQKQMLEAWRGRGANEPMMVVNTTGSTLLENGRRK